MASIKKEFVKALYKEASSRYLSVNDLCKHYKTL
jgi:hypothetical protein